MKLSQSYIEMLNSGLNRPIADGARSYPVAAMEILLMDHAQQRAHSREASVFRQLCLIFDWQLTNRQQNNYVRQLKQGHTLVVTDSAKVIVWTSHSFLQMTGYRSTEAIGQKPLMLQGPDTDPTMKERVRGQLEREETVKADLLNYRKDGSTYTCRISIEPLRNAQGELTHFLAVENEIA